MKLFLAGLSKGKQGKAGHPFIANSRTAAAQLWSIGAFDSHPGVSPTPCPVPVPALVTADLLRALPA